MMRAGIAEKKLSISMLCSCRCIISAHQIFSARKWCRENARHNVLLVLSPSADDIQRVDSVAR
jgi:hypothetical protein